MAQTPPVAPTATDLALVNRIGWGLSADNVADLQREGAEAWLQSQLHPAPGDHLPPAVQIEIKALAVDRLPMAQLVRDSDGATRFANMLPSPDLRNQAQTLYQRGSTS